MDEPWLAARRHSRSASEQVYAILGLLGAIVVVVLGDAAARAQSGPEGDASAVGAADWREQVARLEAGYRGVVLTRFAPDEYLSGPSLTVSRTVYAQGPFAFAPGISWDYGAVTFGRINYDYEATALHVNRFMLPLEARMHFGPWGYVFARVAPGLAWNHAEARESVTVDTLAGPVVIAPAPLKTSLWVFTVDASAGYTIPVAPLPNRPGRSMRVWLQGDVGYSWVANENLILAPATSVEEPTTPGLALLWLGALRGPFFRFAFAVSY